MPYRKEPCWYAYWAILSVSGLSMVGEESDAVRVRMMRARQAQSKPLLPLIRYEEQLPLHASTHVHARRARACTSPASSRISPRLFAAYPALRAGSLTLFHFFFLLTPRLQRTTLFPLTPPFH